MDIFSYKGNVKKISFDKLLNLIEKKVNMYFVEDKRVRMKTFAIVIELIQNIYHHGSSHLNEDSEIPISFSIQKTDDNVFALKASNILENSKIEWLKNKLDQINSLSKAGLDKVYLERLMYTKLNEKEGAGLGFLYIRRKTGNTIQYSFTRLNELISEFEVVISFK
ncbi:MAG: DUF6272 family protein [Cytophagales bacterium]|nr:DUF6272 family protein [Cytophagales bacterium]